MGKQNPIYIGNKIQVGGNKIIVMAGPCAVENAGQIEETARAVKNAGAQVLRGGAYKGRTSPHDFAGLGAKGLVLLSNAAKNNNLLAVTEILDIRDVDLIYKYIDIFQIGSRNMQNVNLLKEIGKTDKPVLLKRGMSATIKEFLLAAEHIMTQGNKAVILCERGIRTFETETRYTLALETIPLSKKLSKLPIMIDPSHSSGKASLVPVMTKAGVAAGADGILIDVHPSPKKALCDGRQALNIRQFKELMVELKPLAKAVGRSI